MNHLYDVLVVKIWHWLIIEQSMNVHINHSWTYNRLLFGRKGYIKAFLNDVAEFVSFTLERSNLSNWKRDVCVINAKILKLLRSEDVKVHLYEKGFMAWYWT